MARSRETPAERHDRYEREKERRGGVPPSTARRHDAKGKPVESDPGWKHVRTGYGDTYRLGRTKAGRIKAVDWRRAERALRNNSGALVRVTLVFDNGEFRMIDIGSADRLAAQDAGMIGALVGAAADGMYGEMSVADVQMTILEAGVEDTMLGAGEHDWSME